MHEYISKNLKTLINFEKALTLSIKDVETIIITKKEAILLTGTISKIFTTFLSPTIYYSENAVTFS